MKRMLAVAFAVGCEARPSAMEERAFGRVADRDVKLFVLRNARGMEARITSYGAILTSLRVPDRRGELADVVLGFDRLEGYLAGHPYFGAMVGRVANRIGGARFALDGRTYELAANDGPNHLHGGMRGFDKAVWDGALLRTHEGPAVELRHLSRDGDEGYPGDLAVAVRYTLTDDALAIDVRARTDRATPVNLTNHAYWNLAGESSGDILGQELWLAADRYTPTDDARIPTGELAPVTGTRFDFTSPRPIGGEYDTNFVLATAPPAAVPRFAARAADLRSGRVMEVWTTEPGLQLYTSNFLDGTLRGKSGSPYRAHQAFCLETQHFPDSVHHPSWPSIILRPGETYRSTTIYRFHAD
jgi:aldose 1-epimerase